MAGHADSARTLARQLTPLGQIPVSVYRACKNDEFGLVEHAASGALMSAIDDLPIKQFRAVFVEWEMFSGIEVGEIYGLIDLCDKHRLAVSADLIALGLRLRDVGTPEFEWSDLKAVVSTREYSPALFRSLYPKESEWDLHAHLAADLVDLTHLLVWFKTADGSKGRNRPKPYPRPGVEDDTKKVRKGDVVTLDSARDLFALPPPA